MTKKYSFIAIDPGSQKAGFCIVVNNKRVRSGTIRLPMKPASSKAQQHYVTRVNMLVDILHSFITEYELKRMVVEDINVVRQSSIRAKEIAGAISYALKNYALSKKLEFEMIPPSQIKKHTTGNGNATKENMREATQEKWKLSCLPDEDEADALGLALLYRHQLLTGVSK